MLLLACVVGLAATASAQQIVHWGLSPFRGPYGPPKHQRQYEAPFPLGTGITSASSGSPPPLPESSASGSPPPSPTAPATGLPPATSATPTFSYDPVSNTSTSYVSYHFAPTGTAPRPDIAGRPTPTGDACTGRTVNVLNASLDWWYTETYTQVDSTFLIQFDANDSATGWTLLPSSTTFNVTSAVANPTCDSTTAFNTLANSTMISYSCWDTPTPVAAVTTTVEQTAYKSVNATTAKGSIPNVGVSPTPASLTIGASNTTNQTYTSGAPIVHFSQYEVVTKRPNRFRNGYVECIESTRTYNLSKVASFEYHGQVNGKLAVNDGVVGDVNLGLLKAFGIADATPGSWVAEPTVVVVVQKVLAAAAVLPASTEVAASSLDTPTPTLPPYIETVRSTPTEPGETWVPLTAHVESSDTALDVPTKTSSKPAPPPSNIDNNRVTTKNNIVTSNFVAQQGGSSVTIAIPVESGGSSVVTAVVSGHTVTATVLPHTDGSNGGNVGLILTAIGNAAKPTNAEEVLSQAELTFHDGGNGDPTASVIASIIGALPLPSPGTNGNGGQNEHSENGSSPGSGSGDSGSSPGAQSNGGGQNGQGSGSGSGSGSSSGSDSGSGTGSGSGSFDQNPVFHIGSQDFTASAVQGHTPPAFLVDGQTVVAGGSPVTIDGTRLSIAPGATAVTIGDTTSALGGDNPAFFANIPIITVGSQRFTANAATQFNLDGSTLTPGGKVVYHGTTISLGPGAGNVVINGQTEQLAPPAITPAPLLTIGGTVYRANRGSTYNIQGHMLTPGGVVVVAGSTISLPSGASDIVVNGVTAPIGGGEAADNNLATITAPPVLYVDGSAFAANGGTSYVIHGQTLTPGGAITYSGSQGMETVSLNAAANELVTIANGLTQTSRLGMIGAAPSGAPLLTIDGTTYTAVDYSAGSGATYVIDGQTLTPGGSIVLTGESGVETISLVPAGTALISIHSGTTTTSHIAGAYGVLQTEAPILTIGDETFTAINNGATYVIHRDTLTPGGTDTVVIDGKTYVVTLSPHATMLEIHLVGTDGSIISTIFETLFPATMTGSTITNTAFVNGATATVGASISNSSPSATSSTSPEVPNKSSSSRVIELTAVLMALSSFALAILL